MINGWSLFTPTFKKIGENAKIDLKTIVPKTPKGATICLKDSTVYIKIMDEGGNYNKTYKWQGKSLADWAEDGKTTSITNGEVMIGEGLGIAVYNSLRVDNNGSEKTSVIGSTPSPAVFQVSGEVDFICKNTVISGWSLNGNSTPVPINLKNIVPTTPKGATICLKDGTVYIKVMDEGGNYNKTYKWQGKSLNAWAVDGETKPIGDTEVIFDPGASFAVYNSLRVDSNGAEKTSVIGSTLSPAVLALPIPGQAKDE